MPEYTEAELAAGAEAVLEWRVWPQTGCGSGEDMARAVLDAAAALIAARVREQVAQDIEISMGERCPTCRGKPASLRWTKGWTRAGRCGAGHLWETDTRGWPSPVNIARYGRSSPDPGTAPVSGIEDPEGSVPEIKSSDEGKPDAR